METLADITDRFRFIEDSLVYVDTPVEGFVVHIPSGARYAFRSREIVARTVWHWVMLPAGEDVASVSTVFASAHANAPSEWLSLLEDRREGAPKLSLVAMRSDKTPPPIDRE